MKLQMRLNRWFRIGRYASRLRQHGKWGAIAWVTCLIISVIGLSTLAQEPRTPISLLIRAVEAEQLALLETAFEAENPDIDIRLVERPKRQ